MTVATRNSNCDGMVLGLAQSARHGMYLLQFYGNTHSRDGNAVLRERLSDLARLGETNVIRELLHELRARGLSLPP